MSLTAVLSDWTCGPHGRWILVANRYLPGCATALLVVVIAYNLAEVTWTLAPGALPSMPTPVSKVTMGQPAQIATVDATQLAEAHMFGQPPAESSQLAAPVDAPETSLRLNLAGIVAITSENGEGIALIATNGTDQRRYSLGQKIDGTDAELYAVYFDRVILSRAGQLETLRLL